MELKFINYDTQTSGKVKTNVVQIEQPIKQKSAQFDSTARVLRTPPGTPDNALHWGMIANGARKSPYRNLCRYHRSPHQAFPALEEYDRIPAFRYLVKRY